MFNKSLTLLISTFMIVSSAQAEFSKESFASTVLGQTINLSDVATFQQREPNNGPNSFGISNATSVAVDTESHRLFVADTGNYRILVFNLTEQNTLGEYEAKYVLGQKNLHSIDTSPSENKIEPTDLVLDSKRKRLFVSVKSTNQIVVYDVSTIENGEAPIARLGGNNSFVVSAQTLNQPGSLYYDQSKDHLYVADRTNGRVLIFDVATVTENEPAIYVLGKPNFTSNEYNSTPTKSNIIFPSDLDMDFERGLLFVIDGDNRRILIFDINTISDGEDPIYVLGQDDFESNVIADESNHFISPISLAYDFIHKKLFVTDDIFSEDRTRILSFDLSEITNGEDAENIFGFGQTRDAAVHFPSGLTFDATTDLLYVVDSSATSRNHRIIAFDVTSVSDDEKAVAVLGQVTGLTNPTPSFNQLGQNNGVKKEGLNDPTGILLDSEGNRLFVSDSNNNRVLIFNLDDKNQLIDSLPDYVLGQDNFNELLAGTSASSMSFPSDLTYDPERKLLFVADLANSRVLVFDVNSISNGEEAIRVIGQPDFSSNNPLSSASGLRFPQGLAYDSSRDYLYVSDRNHRVLVFNVQNIENGEDAIYVLGQTDFTASSPGFSQSMMSGVNGLSFDQDNNRLFVNDVNNGRVLIFDVTQIVNGENAVAVLGSEDFTSQGPTTGNISFSGVPFSVLYVPDLNKLFVGAQTIHVFDVDTISNGEEWLFKIGTSKKVSVGRGIFNPAGLTYDPVSERLWTVSENSVLGVNRDPSFFPPKTTIANFIKKVNQIRPGKSDISETLISELELLIADFEQSSSNESNSKKKQKVSNRTAKVLSKLLDALNSFNTAESKKQQRKYKRRIKKFKKAVRKTLRKARRLK